MGDVPPQERIATGGIQAGTLCYDGEFPPCRTYFGGTPPNKRNVAVGAAGVAAVVGAAGVAAVVVGG